MQTRDARLLNGLGHQAERNAAQLEVELEAGDAFLGAGDLAVHVAERIFPADDVSQQLVFRNLVLGIMLGAQADADAAHRAGHWHAGVHERKAAAAYGSHRGGAVGLHDLAGNANGVGIRIERHHRLERTLGQRAVANLATAWAADAAGFADGEVREVVVENEFLLGGAAGVGVELLGVFASAQRNKRDGLRLAALKHCRTVCPGQETHFAHDRSDGLKIAPVQAFALVHDEAANRLLLDVVEGVLEHELGDLLRSELLHELLADFHGDGRDSAFAVKFAGGEQGRNNAVARQRLGFLENLFRDHVQRDLALGLANARGQILLGRNHRLNRVLAELECCVEIRVADLLG